MAITGSQRQFQPTREAGGRGEAQVVTVHGKPAAVVVSAEQYARLTRGKGRLSTALLQPDLGIDEIDLARSRDTGRDIAL